MFAVGLESRLLGRGWGQEAIRTDVLDIVLLDAFLKVS